MNQSLRDISGRITITLTPRCLDGTAGYHASLGSTRPVDLPKSFEGKPVAAMPALIGMLFGICRRAQMCASLNALEAAANIERPAHVHVMRTLAVEAEIIRERLLYLVGRPHSDYPAMVAEMKEVISKCREIDTACAPAFSLADTIDDLSNLEKRQIAIALGAISAWAEKSVFGTSLDIFRSFELDRFREWIAYGSTIASQHARHVHSLDPNSFHAVKLSALSPSSVHTHLAGENETIAASTMGIASAGDAETGPLAEQHNAPLVKSLVAARGLHPLSRFAARLHDLAGLPSKLLSTLVGDSDPAPNVIRHGPGRATAVVQTARGLLGHGVELNNDRATIENYRIAAPTEWNFAPKGIAVRMLNAMPLAADWSTVADTIIHSIDPCVAVSVEMA